MTIPERSVEIHCVSSCDSSTRKGRYEACISDGSGKVYATGSLEDTTSNRCIIQGMIDLVGRLDSPSTIRLISNTNIGLNKKKGVNFDLTSQLHAAAEKGGHTYTFDILERKECDLLRLIRSADGYEHSQATGKVNDTLQDYRAKSNSRLDYRWVPYTLSPIDFGWEHLSTVEETLRVFLKDEAEAAHEAYESGFALELGDLPYSSADFSQEWASAKAMAEKICGSGELRDNPAVFWVPGEMKFNYAFVFKMENNGTTFVISPVELPWLEQHSITNRIMRNNRSGLQGSFKQVAWAESIVIKACNNYEDIGKLVPSMMPALSVLSELLKAKTDATWIIANHRKLNLAFDKRKRGLAIDGSIVEQHPIIGQKASGMLSRQLQMELEPLIALGKPNVFTA
ncbi:hypothetical protein IFT48_02770 [Pseudomonas fluorescens]|uniref:hypothetical protein n=1 Tax=Pseudomonas fluorescens TaxID=294 RepID=UPI001930E1B9|nr:hypothetical protein [Pseudomonas fluorescens]MBD8088889.1 hypothetical protein [Pseudomonas fluorescens]